MLIREGSVSKDLLALIPLMTERNRPISAFAPMTAIRWTSPNTHLDHMIRTAIAQGVAPLVAYRAASLSAAEAEGSRPDRARQNAPISSCWTILADCRADMVICGGTVVDDGPFAARATIPPVARPFGKAPAITPASFRCAGNRVERRSSHPARQDHHRTPDRGNRPEGGD